MTHVACGPAQAVNRVLTCHRLDQNSRRGRASIFQVAPEEYRQGVEDQCWLRAYSGSHQGVNVSPTGLEQLA